MSILSVKSFSAYIIIKSSNLCCKQVERSLLLAIVNLLNVHSQEAEVIGIIIGKYDITDAKKGMLGPIKFL